MSNESPGPAEGGLIIPETLQAWFGDCVRDAARRTRLEADEATLWYLVNLLCVYARTEQVFPPGQDGARLPVLVDCYNEALEAPTERERTFALQRLGDVALFVAGLYADSLERRLVDIDYYIGMGRQAYAVLADRIGPGLRSRTLGQVYAELGHKFTGFVDVLHEVTETALPPARRDWLRTYEIWLRTGSPRAARLLREGGIVPSEQAGLIRH
jgi:hypothetical protein